MIPKFCPIHTKIHICEENSTKSKIAKNEKDIKTALDRLKGVPVESDLAPKSTKKSSVPKKGTIEYSIYMARKKTDKLREKFNHSDEENFGRVATENELKDKMKALRNKIKNK
ncbi:hypothetical protein NPX79_03545 [Spiroplasma endosymbiont of Anurida maritima]|uniref:hypothetical protein n=1 Tax=Spiroplasma endosymbiont of Anurida maritima TaxID=2967972 RepID=UPI0036D30802